ncbi:unnamed protein product [Phytophthora fragariaefolia]|uniref:Unnamed protein product n=1 Tax=Phytophthora fragariaefolia TaxID=1490495 RepID=A0A9W7D0C2_9STRA|nr:unnamed protein product [Phytophthora fragariaefolia]
MVAASKMPASKKRSSAGIIDKGSKRGDVKEYVSPIKKVESTIKTRDATNIDKPHIFTTEGIYDLFMRNVMSYSTVL